MLLGGNSRRIQVQYLPLLPCPYLERPGSPPQEAPHRGPHDTAVRSMLGNAPINWPEQSRSVSPITELQSSSSSTRTMDPVPGFSCEAQKHVPDHGSKSSSRPKKDTASSLSFSHRDVACSRTHKHNKKSHKMLDLPVLVAEPQYCSVLLKTWESPVLRQPSVLVLALVLSVEHVLRTPGRLESAPGPY